MTETKVKTTVHSVKPLTDTIWQVMLVPETFVPYLAGQYLQILYQGESIFYSIANAPLGANQYELHMKMNKENALTNSLLEAIKKREKLEICLPFGNCTLKDLHPQKPIIFIAGGTGFAPICAMIEQLLADSDPRDFTLYWLVHRETDRYFEEKIQAWQTQATHCRYFALLSGNYNEEHLLQLLHSQHPAGLINEQIIINGAFDKVYSLRDGLLEMGISRKAIFSDAFSFEKE